MKYVLLIGTPVGVTVLKGANLDQLVNLANSNLSQGAAPQGVIIAERNGEDDYTIKFKWPGILGMGLTVQDLP